MIKLVDYGIKRVITDMFKKVEESMSMLRRDMEDTEKTHIRLPPGDWALETGPFSKSAFGELAFRKLAFGELTKNHIKHEIDSGANISFLFEWK